MALPSFLLTRLPLCSQKTRKTYRPPTGNHEADDPSIIDAIYGPLGQDSGGECGVPYYMRLRPPQATPGKLWYSINMGPVHFLQISSEQNFSAGSEQYAFILADLKAVDRAVTPWVIAGFHRPM